MAQGGGKPGFAFRAVAMPEQDNGRIILTPKDPDDELWDYFAKVGTDEFFVQFLPVNGQHHPGGDDQ